MTELEQVVLAALVHDAGKLLERGELLDEYRSDEAQQRADCRRDPEKGHYGYMHVLHTRRFCEVLAEAVPVLRPEQGQGRAGADQHWINLASRHHVASSPLEHIVSIADHLASSEREAGTVYESKTHQRTLLEPVLERVSLSGMHRETTHRQPLVELLPDGDGVFPCALGDFRPLLQQDNREGGAWLSPEPLVADYRRLGEGLLSQLSRLPQPATPGREAIRSLVRTLLALFERYLVNVPSATNVPHPDVSLYDHMRVTAAIAEGLYRHHESEGTLAAVAPEHSPDVAKWRLVCGDLSGIQAFIYRLSSRGAAKGLRGRSLFIQLLSDGVSDFLLRRLGLFPTARIYSSGGKFYLLIADCQEAELRAGAAVVNRWLLQEFGGELSLGLGVAEVRGADFESGRMGDCWKAANEALLRDRLRRFGAVIEADPQGFFDPEPVHREGACQVCGRDDARAALRDDQDRATCGRCRDLERLGRSLAGARVFFWAWGEDRELAAARLPQEAWFPFDGLGCDLYVLDQEPEFRAGDRLDDSVAERLGDPDCCRANPQGYACGFRLLGRWDLSKKSGLWEFDEFAENAEGAVKRLGVLRMDVDNLGKILVTGLKFKTKAGERDEIASLSRVATLSRQLHLFFSGHLGRLLQEYPRSQIIYSGGDDVFLLGSWDELPEVAWAIRREFSRYCGGNPDFTLSGGLAVVGGKYPISRAAKLAGDAEHAAKGLTWQGRKKDAVSLLDTPIPWQDYEAAVALRDHIRAVAEQPGGKALIGRLRNVILAQQEFWRRGLENNLSADQIRELAHWQRWRWQLVYNLKRLVDRRKEWSGDLKTIEEAIFQSRVKGQEAALPVLHWLQLPTRWAEFLTRKEDRR